MMDKNGVARAVKYSTGADFCRDEVDIWIADIDEELNDKAYIVPGLGDAGDLAFGGRSMA